MNFCPYLSGMKLLVIAATAAEIGPLLDGKQAAQGNPVRLQEEGDFQIDVLICGVGAVATAFQLTRILSTNRYDLVLQAGIGGAFDRNITIGEVVWVISERFGQLGAEDDTDFLDVFELGFQQYNQPPFIGGVMISSIPTNLLLLELKEVAAITVETTHGNAAHIQRITEKYHPQLESMEGAAAFYVCQQMHTNCIQLRAVSNYVEKRNKANWNIPLAVTSLNTTLIKVINVLRK